MRVGEALPHDLVEPARIDAVVADHGIPPWVTESLSRAPFVVVRRARNRGDLVPVGVRGRARHERFAAWLSPHAVKTRIRPEDLVRDEAWKYALRAAIVPHFALLDRLAGMMRALEFRWGPTGAVGYELASGIPAVTPASDIDLVLRAPHEVSRERARLLLAELASLLIRIDVQIETPFGAIALAEYCAEGAQIALRTVDGPRLVSDPWALETCGPSP